MGMTSEGCVGRSSEKLGLDGGDTLIRGVCIGGWWTTKGCGYPVWSGDMWWTWSVGVWWKPLCRSALGETSFGETVPCWGDGKHNPCCCGGPTWQSRGINRGIGSTGDGFDLAGSGDLLGLWDIF